jgi:Integrase core domain
MANQIKRAYLTPHLKSSFTGLGTFLKNTKFKNKNAVEEELNSIAAFSLHKVAKKRFKTRRVVVNWLNFQLGADLIDLSRFSSENKGVKYIFVIVCAFSKFLIAKPLKDKKGDTLLKAFRQVFKEKRFKTVKFLHIDQGGEFLNKKVQDFLASKGVKSFHTFSPWKVSGR